MRLNPDSCMNYSRNRPSRLRRCLRWNCHLSFASRRHLRCLLWGIQFDRIIQKYILFVRQRNVPFLLIVQRCLSAPYLVSICPVGVWNCRPGGRRLPFPAFGSDGPGSNFGRQKKHSRLSAGFHRLL